jgi:hypothetical protein
MEWIFVESGEFTRRIVKHGLQAELAQVQAELRDDPRCGVVEPGTCGLRRMPMPESARWNGRRFGVRIHYALVPREAAIYLLAVGRNDAHPAWTPEQKRELCSRLRTWGAR